MKDSILDDPSKMSAIDEIRGRVAGVKGGDTDPMRFTYALLGNKWTPLTLILLNCGPCRFLELQRHLHELMQEMPSRRMLTFTLRRIEREGLIDRDIKPQVPPRVDYSITPLGAEFVAIIRQVARFVRVHEDDITRARERFDEDDNGSEIA